MKKGKLLPAAAGMCALLLAGTPLDARAGIPSELQSIADAVHSPAQSAIAAVSKAVTAAAGAGSMFGASSSIVLTGEPQLNGICYTGNCTGFNMARNSTLMAWASTNNTLLRKITEMVVQWSKEQIAVGVAFTTFGTQMKEMIGQGSLQLINTLKEGSKVLAGALNAADFDPLQREDPCLHLAAGAAAIKGEQRREAVETEYRNNMRLMGDGVYKTASEAENAQQMMLLDKIDRTKIDASLFFGVDSSGTGSGMQYGKPIGADKAQDLAVVMNAMACLHPVGMPSEEALKTYNGRMALQLIQAKAAYVETVRAALAFVASLHTSLSAYQSAAQSLQKDTGNKEDLLTSTAQSLDEGGAGISTLQYLGVYVDNLAGGNNKIRAIEGTGGTVGQQRARIEPLRLRISMLRSKCAKYRTALMAALAGMETSLSSFNEANSTLVRDGGGEQ